MALEGADRVNDELEVGFDRAFERRWHVAEQVGRGAMVVFLGAGLLGLFGRGPYSHAQQTDATGTISVDYEPVARYGTATMVTLHLRHGDVDIRTIHLSDSFGEPMGLQQIVPQPLRQQAEASGFSIVEAMPPQGGEAMLRLVVKPSAVGLIRMSIRTDGTSLSWSQLVLP